MAMKTRLEAISAHWATMAQYYGGANAKRYRTNLKRASTAARETADLFARFEGEGRHLVADDIETLRKAANLLHALSEEFEVAQKKADRVKANKIAEAEAKRKAEVSAVLVELFGSATPWKTVPEEVLSMGLDLALFDRAGVDEMAKEKGCSKGLLSGSFNIGTIKWDADRGKAEPVAMLLAENRLDTRYPGKKHYNTHHELWYHAGWDDFIAWRKIRQQVRALATPPEGTEP